jgi:hypothetical protein
MTAQPDRSPTNTSDRFSEYDSVRLRVSLAVGSVIYPSGTTAVIVHVHKGKGAYEVELFEPEPGVVTLEDEDLELLTRAPA